MSNVHNAIDRAGDLVRGFRRVLGLTGSDQGVERLGESIYPVIDIWTRPEWALLRDERLVVGHSQVGAIAAQRAFSQFFNPVVSTRLAVIERVWVSSQSAGGAIEFFWDDTARGVPNASPHRRDFRAITSLVSADGTLRDGNAAAPVGGVKVGHYIMGAVNRSWPIELDFVIPPGYGLTVAQATDNLTLEVWWFWREREMLPGEDVAELR